jgi:hypothetical protein
MSSCLPVSSTHVKLVIGLRVFICSLYIFCSLFEMSYFIKNNKTTLFVCEIVLLLLCAVQQEGRTGWIPREESRSLISAISSCDICYGVYVASMLRTSYFKILCIMSQEFLVSTSTSVGSICLRFIEGIFSSSGYRMSNDRIVNG